MARSLAALLVLLSALVATPAQAAPAVFAHPGVMVSRAQLDFVKGRVQANAQPWKAAFDQMAASPFASLTRNPTPRAVVECGSCSNPNIGCTDERQDALAAYTLALRWYITGDARYATKAISIMDAWSAVLRDHTNSNAPLQSAWAASTWPRAAEIIRYTYTGGWPNMQRFATMLRDVYLPEVVNGSSSNGNWELSMMEAAIGIAVFLEDKAVYDRAVTRFKARAAAFLYVTADGPQPKYPPVGSVDTYNELVSFWHGETTFVDGLSQETCRDFTHTGCSISAISHVAETSRIQGQDLYPELADRLRHALGFHSKYQLGTAVPVVAVRRLAAPGPRPGDRGRLQRAEHADGHRNDQHPDPDRTPSAGRHQLPVRGVGRPSPREEPELAHQGQALGQLA